MSDDKWRVTAKCEKCGTVWKTKAKSSPGAPTRCKDESCGSYRTEGIKAYKVNN